jgi:hypothetical protein
MSHGRRGTSSKGRRHKRNRRAARDGDGSRGVLMGYLDAANDFAEDFPDGARQANMLGAVEQFNQSHGTDYDPYEEFQRYVEWKGMSDVNV